MTREEAIYELKNAAWLGTDHSRARTEDAVDMAIQSLEQQKVKEIHGIMEGGWTVNFEMPEQETCTDAVSREAVLDEIDDTNRRGGFGCKLSYTRCRGHIEQLPPIPQKSETVTEFADRCRECGKMRKGHWIDFDYPWFRCSECGSVRENKSFLENYCPNCGCRMVEPQESEDKE